MSLFCPFLILLGVNESFVKRVLRNTAAFSINETKKSNDECFYQRFIKFSNEHCMPAVVLSLYNRLKKGVGFL